MSSHNGLSRQSVRPEGQANESWRPRPPISEVQSCFGCGGDRRCRRTSINTWNAAHPPAWHLSVTGRGFLPGQSGNPKGRPHTKGLLTALRNKVAEIAPDGRTIEEQLVDVLVSEALDSRNRLPAVEIIFDRLEGRTRQRLEVADVTAQLREKSDEELQFYLDNNRWPDEAELLLLGNSNAVNQDGRNTWVAESQEIQEGSQVDLTARSEE